MGDEQCQSNEKKTVFSFQLQAIYLWSESWCFIIFFWAKIIAESIERNAPLIFKMNPKVQMRTRKTVFHNLQWGAFQS